jgi:hypothetical protein
MRREKVREPRLIYRARISLRRVNGPEARRRRSLNSVDARFT